MKILIIEDDESDCNNFIKCAQNRDDVEIEITDSDVEALRLVKINKPEGIALDLELNNSKTGSADGLDFMTKLKECRLNYEPIIIVTTHINSKTTYDMLHRAGVDLILYKDQLKYSSDYVFNKFLSLRKYTESKPLTIKEEIQNNENRISDLISDELELVGINSKMKGRQYIHDAILYLVENDNKSNDSNPINYLAKKYNAPKSTITNNMQNAINKGWNTTPVDELLIYYKARIRPDVGVPSPMELIYYYAEKIKKLI